jgi:hypothetical protein
MMKQLVFQYNINPSKEFYFLARQAVAKAFSFEYDKEWLKSEQKFILGYRGRSR